MVFRVCVPDFETASWCDLKKAGAWRYSEDPTTEILCLAFQVLGEPKDGPVELWLPAMLGGFEPSLFGPAQALRALVDDPDIIFAAHNAGFEKAIWRNIMVAQFGFPDIPNKRWHDTLAACAMKVLPQQLERALQVLRLEHQKDMEGSRLTKAMSKPNKAGYFDRSPAKLQRVYDYCRSDIRGQVGLYKRTGPLPAGERNVWLLDQRINERGVLLDLPFISQARRIVDAAMPPLALEFADLTGGLKVTQAAKVKQWVLDKGVDIPNLTKETLIGLLGSAGTDAEEEDFDVDISDADEIELPPDVHRALSIRQLIGSASIKKLGRMEACVCHDGRARGLLQYHGAGPGRWAGRLLQPQNFPRGTIQLGGKAPPVAVVVDTIMSGDPIYVELLLGPPVEVVVSALRYALIADAELDRHFVAGDYAGIEARFVLAFAGQHDKTALMASGADVYIDMAIDIYGMERFDVTQKALIEAFKAEFPDRRQTGKNSVLGLGFQMGANKFQSRYAKDQPFEFAQRVVNTYRKDWAPCVPNLWYALERAATRTVWDRTPHEAYGVLYALEDGWLTARLPSGRKLWYFDPQPTRKPMPWDPTDIRPSFSYKAMKMGQWRTIDAFGGLLTENVIQGLARDLLVHAMFKCERENLPIVLTVHDEILAEPKRDTDKIILAQVMEDVPQWVKSIQVPVAVECWSGERYKK